MLVGIGTVLDRRLPAVTPTYVFGTGTGYLDPPSPEIVSQWRVKCVRGPLTAAALGLPPEAAVTDGAALLRLLDLPDPGRVAGRVGFMPHHHLAVSIDWSAVCGQAGLTYIDPRGATLEVLDSIRRCELVLAEAMHGAIISDLYRVPWIPVATGAHIFAPKWLDWTASMSVPYQPQRWSGRSLGHVATSVVARTRTGRLFFPSGALADFLATTRERVQPTLSDEAVLDARLSRMAELLDELRLEAGF